MPSRPATPVVVSFNGAPIPEARALSIVRSAGGGELDHATLEIDLKAAGSRLANIVLQAQAGAVTTFVGFPNGVPNLFHWGFASLASIELAPGTERLPITSRVEPWHFGAQLTGWQQWDPNSSQLLTVPEDVVINPEVDGVAIGNQSSVPWLQGQFFSFLDPESTRTTNAQQFQQDNAQQWTLYNLLQSLCAGLNDQTYIQNPSVLSLALLPQYTPDALTLPRGGFLPEYLDQLLGPAGLGWYLDLTSGQPTIAFFIRGVGVPNVAVLSPPGNQVTPGVDNAVETHIDYNLGNVRNQINVWGDWHYLESTFTLTQGWDRSLDNVDEKLLYKDNPDNPGYQQTPTYRDVWRKWVLNEAGDYPTAGAAKPPYDLSTLFGHPMAARRRKFLPTLTLGADGAPYGETGGIDVQYSLDQGTTWLPIAQLEDRTCLVLERECGIRFDGLMPPRELLNPPSGFTAMVRVTATMRDDLRLGATVGPDGTSPLAGLAPAFLDESERWHWREVGAKSRFNGVSGLTANTADDTIQINLYAQWLYNVWDLADVCGMIAVEGLDSGFPYDLGQVIVGIAGRQISFNGKSAASGQQSYPQVVAIELDVQNQRQILHLETYRDPGAVTPIRGAALARMQTAVKRSIRQRRR